MARSGGKAEVLCRMLLEEPLAARNANAVLGFDVEYCTLERIIKPNIPALVQLASPSVVGLFWLDKFPDHGRDLLSTGPLASILRDPQIIKVGLGVYNDAVNLEDWGGQGQSWCNVEGTFDLSHFPEAPDPTKEGKRIGLEHYCKVILHKKLSKKKTGGSRKKDAKKAFWRAKVMTKEVRACDKKQREAVFLTRPKPSLDKHDSLFIDEGVCSK